MKKKSEINFNSLVEVIQQIHKELAQQASCAVNVSLTLRNWLIGGYIHKYELLGSDRAKYGDKLIEKLAQSLGHIPRTQKRELNRYRLFYKVYPQIGESVTPQFKANLKLKELALLQTGETLSPQSKYPNDLVLKLSFSHLDLLVAIENNTKRAFYEMECICGNWSVRELKRQINSFYYERSGLSLDKEKFIEEKLRETDYSGRKDEG